jgi:hypothetical protein
MLKPQRRHQPPRKRPMWDQASRNSSARLCGMLNGHRVSMSTSKFLPPDKARDLEAARDPPSSRSVLVGSSVPARMALLQWQRLSQNRIEAVIQVLVGPRQFVQGKRSRLEPPRPCVAKPHL